MPVKKRILRSNEVKRDITGDVVFTDVGAGLTTTTTTTSATVTVTTGTIDEIQATNMIAKATGGFTTATITLLRNGSTITSTTGGTGMTLTTSNTVNLEGKNTFTAKLHLTAGTPGTLTFTAQKNQKRVVR